MTRKIGEKIPNFSDFIPKNAKFTWTCAEHEECKTCEYFYSSCSGLSNSSDPRNQNIPEDINRYLQINWTKTDNRFIYWKRKQMFPKEYRKICNPKKGDPNEKIYK